MAVTLPTKTRTVTGKKVAALRRNHQLPLVVYGRGRAARSLQASAKEFRHVFDEAGTTSLIDLVVDNGTPLNVLVHEVDHDPVSGHLLHADLLEVDMTKTITAEVPLVFVNEAPAVRELDGTLLTNQDTLEVECLPKNLPREITVNLASLKTFDDTITAGMVMLPTGVTLITDAEIDLVFVQPPREEEPEEVVVSAEDAEKQAIEGMEAAAEAKAGKEESDEPSGEGEGQ